MGQPSDYDSSGSFLVIIPDDVSLCSAHYIGRTWQQELSMVGRIDLKAGHYVFPPSSFHLALCSWPWQGSWEDLEKLVVNSF